MTPRTAMLHIDREAPADVAGIETLLDRAFGSDRHLKTCQRLRDGQNPSLGLSFVARDQGMVIGTLRFWDLLIGGQTRALLLGPLAVDPDRQSEGLGGRLVRHGLNQAAVRGHGAVILVGDEPYYRRFGFTRTLTMGMNMPGPVESHRFLGLELSAGSLRGACGLVSPQRPARAASRLPWILRAAPGDLSAVA